jgi:tripartite-type tricarboxylate transporter receptor subunit TctC
VATRRVQRAPAPCRSIGVLCAGFVALTAGEVHHATAQPFPVKPMRMIVPFEPGGATDAAARVVARAMSEQVGQQVLVDNRGGGGTIVGTETVARAGADGYTLLFTTEAYAFNAVLQPRLPYDPLRSLTPVSIIGTQPRVLVVSAASGLRSIRDLVEAAKARPGQSSYGSSGVGSGPHFTGAMFVHQAGFNAVHVPYKGSAPALTDLLGGQIQFIFVTPISAAPMVQAGKLVPLAVTSLRRAASLAEVPTLDESGLRGFESISWMMAFTPGGTAPAINERIHAEMRKALGRAEVRDRLQRDGMDIVAEGPEAAASLLRSELARWRSVVKSASIKPD